MPAPYIGVYPLADGVVDTRTSDGVPRTPYPVAAADGSYPTPGVDWNGGMGSFEVMGTFGGGTAKLQILGADLATWLDVGSSTSFTANGTAGFYAPAGLLRMTLSGSTAPSLKAFVRQIPQ